MKAARLVVLGVAVAAGGVAAFLAGRQKPPPPKPEPVKVESLEVLVAKGDIGMGHTLTPQDMQWQGGWSTTANVSNFIRKKDRPDAMVKLSGTIARSPFVTGEPIREAKLVQANGSGYMAAILPQGMRAVSTTISPETGAGGFILPGDHVDVLLTRRDREAEKATGTEVQTSEIILRNIRVLAIDQTVEEKNGQKVVVGKTATFELTPAQAETLVLAQKLGSISLALRSITDSQASDTGDQVEEPGRKRGSVNVIRFGVSTTTATK